MRRHLDMEVGFLSEFAGGQRKFLNVDCEPGKGPQPGAADLLEETYCHKIATGKLAGIIPDTSAEPQTACMPVTKTLGIGCYLGVPIVLPGGHVFGTLCCYSGNPNTSLNDRDLSTLTAFAEIATQLIEMSSFKERSKTEMLFRIRDVLENDLMAMHLQPIMDLGSDTVSSFEALARFETAPQQGPDKWFEDAQEVGADEELQLHAIKKALEALPALPQEVTLSINASPSVVLSPRFARLFTSAPLDRVMLELTEHAAIENYRHLHDALSSLRSAGLKVAVDDAGAGYSTFQHILNLQADVIKLDRSLVTEIDRNLARQALASSLIFFSRQTGSRLIAEGVETKQELETLRHLGVEMAQGYLMGRPAPLQNALESHTGSPLANAC
ncbi:EAL domain-containing protein (putative c-di-GMP-specific phosphodiesterase class I) [Roseibium hamelinense]|uniref:EAL domain-containing protein (Putative c-di-GMP-specific phosphodiesterase class I) n=2 Tax=Roseibium hamelinense TaxID=150831 RepID=A0A562SF29_9HYPH|nr:EAL domain-containing protein (putative c-di-GMP-specific phosphodiesterase class I) [Roseibium hamelinense]